MPGRQSKFSRVIAAGIVAAFAALVLAVFVPLLGARLPSSYPMFGEGVEASMSNVITIDQPLQLSASPAISVTKGVFYAGSRPVPGPRPLVLDQPVFEIDLAAKLSDEHDLAEATGNALVLPLYQQLSALGFETVDIKRGTARIRWAGGEEESVTAIDTKLTPRKNGLLAIDGSLVVRGQPLKIEGTIGPPSRPDVTRAGLRGSGASAVRERLWPLRITVRGSDIFARIEGSATNNAGVEVNGIADISIPQIANFLRWQGIGWSASSGGNAATLRGPINWSAGALSFQEALFSIDGQEGTGALTFRYRNGRPLVEGTVAVENLNAGTLFRSATASTMELGASIPWTGIATALPSILAVDADLRVSAKRLLLNATPIGRAVAAFTVRDAIMHADIADLEVGSVRGSVQVTADMTKASPTYTVRGRFDAPDVNWLSEPLLAASFPRAKVVGTVELAGMGLSVGDLLRDARGKLNVTMPEGARLPLDLRALRQLVQAQKGREFQGWGISASENAFDEIELKSQIEPGRIVIDRLLLKSKAFSATATGTLNRTDKLMWQNDLDLQAMLGPPAAIAKVISIQRPSSAALPVGTTRVATSPDADIQSIVIRGPLAAPMIGSMDKAPNP